MMGKCLRNPNSHFPTYTRKSMQIDFSPLVSRLSAAEGGKGRGSWWSNKEKEKDQRGPSHPPGTLGASVRALA